MQRHRILALLLAVMLTVSYTLGRLQTVRAATTLTAQQIDILYGLLASGGVIAAKEGTDSKKRQTITDWATSAPDASTWTATKYLDGWTADDSGNYHYTPAVDTTLQDVKSWLSGLRTSVVDYWSSVFSVSAPTSWTQYTAWRDYTSKTVVPFEVHGSYLFSCKCVSNSIKTTASVLGVRDGVAFSYNVATDGTVTYMPGHGKTAVGAYFRVKSYSNSHNIALVLDDGTSLYSIGVSNISNSYDDTALVWGADGVYEGIGTGSISHAGVGAVLGTVDTGIDCDTWSDTLGRDMVDDNKDVVILGGQDLAGYDTVDSVRSGYVTGVDWGNTGNPDVPVPGDVPGKLDSIIDFLKSLPALLGSTLIGNGSLDFSGFQDIQLTTVFPFCIPFDLINSFKYFDVAPIEPKWTVDLKDTAYEAGGSIELDFTTFDTLFIIGRYLIYGSFVFCLIVGTRKLIKG